MRKKIEAENVQVGDKLQFYGRRITGHKKKPIYIVEKIKISGRDSFVSKYISGPLSEPITHNEIQMKRMDIESNPLLVHGFTDDYIFWKIIE